MQEAEWRRILVFYDSAGVSKSKMRENQDFSKSGNGMYVPVHKYTVKMALSNIYVVLSE